MDADAAARRSFHVESLGCAKNQVDSERMISALLGAGWQLAAEPQEADVLIVNTCGFISSAKKESIETTLELKQRYPGKKVIMVGCLSERYGEDLARQLPEVDGFLGNRDPAAILGLLSDGPPGGSLPAPEGSLSVRDEAPRPYERPHLLSFPGSAYLKIAEGCANRCTYCAIPLIRGDLASRPPSEIILEARQLIDRGIRELILIAQDLGSYGRDAGESVSLPLLLDELSGIAGDFWVRLLYIHPDHFPYGILPIMSRDPRILPYFDLPFQHAAPAVLRAMGRRADPEANCTLLDRIRETLPGAVIRSTFLLGFPGESEQDFEDLLAFQSRARPDWLGCFTYSREEDTPAYAMRGRVAKREAERRKAQVELRQGPITDQALDARVGKVLDVLVEEKVEGEELSLGRAYLQAPDVDGLVVVRRSLERGHGMRCSSRSEMASTSRDRPLTDEPGYFAALNPEQRAAVVHSGSPLLILAGAGSGKTRVITTKIAHLVHSEGANPRSILAVTFTNKAAQEMKERVLAIVPHADDVMVRTFHSFGAWFLRRNAKLAGLAPGFRIYDEDDSLSLLKTILGKGEDRGFLRRTYEEISRLKDLGIGPEAAFEEIQGAGCDPKVYADYERRKQETGNVDFGDLILKPLQLLRKHPEVRARSRQRFRIVLVDEYQDSNVAQFELLRELWEPGIYLCVVGDDDQSIYRFRGAEVGNILSFPDVFPGTQVVRLERNYRSTQAILDVASAVVAHNTGRLGKTLWTENASGDIPLVACLLDQDEEAQLCASIVRDDFPGTTAILYRMNAQSLPFETLFQRLGIRYRLIGSLRFYEREEVKDAIAYLSLLANGNDEVAFRRIVNKPVRGIGASSVSKIVSEWSAGDLLGRDLLGACRSAAGRLSSRARAGLVDLLAVLEELSGRLEDTPLAELARLLLARTGLYEMYRTRERSDEAKRKTENLEAMVSDMANYGAGAEALSAFLERVALASPLDTSDADAEAPVALITAHNTKGLEFDRVVITGLEEGIFPHSSSLGSADDVEEERRLFYVGATRARQQLVMTWCVRRRLFGRTTEMSRSRFLDEVPDELVRETGQPRAALAEQFPVGSGVYHDEYGTGVVERTWYTDGAELVQVRFQSGRVGKFIPKYARLERVDLG